MLYASLDSLFFLYQKTVDFRSWTLLFGFQPKASVFDDPGMRLNKPSLTRKEHFGALKDTFAQK